MCKRFLKLNLDNDESEFLALHHPNAFILLFFIAKRARRTSGHADGLGIGECHIGDWKSYGLTEREYRTAKSVLIYRKIILILQTCRNRKKSTTGTTTIGTLVKLLDSKVWDINPESDDDRNDDRATTERRPSDDEQEGRRRNKKEEENKNIAQTAARPRSKDSLSFDFEKWEYVGISEKDLVDWKIIYPSIDFAIEITKSINWLKSNPTKSHKTNWRKFLTGWLQRANETFENKKAFRAASGSSLQDKRTKNKDGTPIQSRAEDLF